MMEEIFETISKYMTEKVKVSKGVIVLIGICSFVFGLVTGVCAAKLTMKRKIKTVYAPSGDEFDADEYVRNLCFDDDEE